ncbi:MAG: hypothetical protein RL538_321 [Candidatus Parcubacteria bacterium]|jgi:hypothetical protein
MGTIRDYTNLNYVIEYTEAMKILILSPLFPPDTGAPAPYTKELATRLGAAHEVKLLIYGYLPEGVENVPITAIDKRSTLLLRLIRFTKTLFAMSRECELIIVQNAPSIELPAFLISRIKKTPMLLIKSDPLAEERSKRGIYRLLHTLLSTRCDKTLTLPNASLYQKAELLPFTEFDTQTEAMREAWWKQHVAEIKV